MGSFKAVIVLATILLCSLSVQARMMYALRSQCLTPLICLEKSLGVVALDSTGPWDNVTSAYIGYIYPKESSKFIDQLKFQTASASDGSPLFHILLTDPSSSTTSLLTMDVTNGDINTLKVDLAGPGIDKQELSGMFSLGYMTFPDLIIAAEDRIVWLNVTTGETEVAAMVYDQASQPSLSAVGMSTFDPENQIASVVVKDSSNNCINIIQVSLTGTTPTSSACYDQSTKFEMIWSVPQQPFTKANWAYGSFSKSTVGSIGIYGVGFSTATFTPVFDASMFGQFQWTPLTPLNSLWVASPYNGVVYGIVSTPGVDPNYVYWKVAINANTGAPELATPLTYGINEEQDFGGLSHLTLGPYDA